LEYLKARIQIQISGLPFLQLISEDRFRAIDKIKTIGSTYMAAVGLIPEYKILDDNEDGGLSAVHYVAQVSFWNILGLA
jgi:hypothetical protein